MPSYRTLVAEAAPPSRRVGGCPSWPGAPTRSPTCSSPTTTCGGDPFKAATDGCYRPLLRFPCCLLWVDVDGVVLDDYLDQRVDDMVSKAWWRTFGSTSRPRPREKGCQDGSGVEWSGGAEKGGVRLVGRGGDGESVRLRQGEELGFDMIFR